MLRCLASPNPGFEPKFANCQMLHCGTGPQVVGFTVRVALGLLIVNTALCSVQIQTIHNNTVICVRFVHKELQIDACSILFCSTVVHHKLCCVFNSPTSTVLIQHCTVLVTHSIVVSESCLLVGEECQYIQRLGGECQSANVLHGSHLFDCYIPQCGCCHSVQRQPQQLSSLVQFTQRVQIQWFQQFRMMSLYALDF